MAKMRDVARAAGVSIATVSAVLSGKKFVSPALRRRVRRAINAVNYQPDAIARSLKSGTTKSVALIVTDITNPFFTSVAASVEGVARAAGYTVVLCNTDEDVEKERICMDLMRMRRVDGIILAPAGARAHYGSADKRPAIPLVTIDRMIDGFPADAVTVDNAAATRTAIEYLLKLGHSRIGLITGPRHLSTSRERLDGYRMAMDNAGLALNRSLVLQGNFRREDAYLAALRMLRGRQRPTAIFASNNLMALGALRATRECNLKCPDDISIASFDDFEEAPLFTPGLTTIAQPTAEIGRRAFALLLDRMNDAGKRRAPRHQVLDLQFHIRGSCSYPAGHEAKRIGSALVPQVRIISAERKSA